MEDILEKYLRYTGYNVKRVMNITDVGHLTSDADEGEDKMLKGAKREHKSVMEIAKFYTDAFFSDCAKLNIKTPDVVEPATNCIDEYIKIITKLMDTGYAYFAGGNVYFDTSKLEKYYIFNDFKEEDLNVGKIDCIWNGMSINPARAEAMNLSEPYMKNEMIFVVPADSEIKSMDDLAGKTIGVQTGSTAQEILEAADLYADITESPLEDNVTALNQMELGFSDAVFLDSVVANYLITSHDKDYVILDGNLEAEEYAIGFRKNDQALRDEVQKQLSEMKADGKLGEISEKWFGSDITTVK